MYYTYEEAQKKLNSAVEDSGLRKYCSDTCKGHCCNGCPLYKEDPRSCKKLSCTAFICEHLMNLIFSTESKEAYYTLSRQLVDEECCFIPLGKNVYFLEHQILSKARKEMKVKRELIDGLVAELKNGRVEQKIRALQTLYGK